MNTRASFVMFDSTNYAGRAAAVSGAGVALIVSVPCL